MKLREVAFLTQGNTGRTKCLSGKFQALSRAEIMMKFRQIPASAQKRECRWPMSLQEPVCHHRNASPNGSEIASLLEQPSLKMLPGFDSASL